MGPSLAPARRENIKTANTELNTDLIRVPDPEDRNVAGALPGHEEPFPIGIDSDVARNFDLGRNILDALYSAVRENFENGNRNAGIDRVWAFCFFFLKKKVHFLFTVLVKLLAPPPSK